MEEEKKNVKKEGEERKNEKKGGSEREEIYRQMGEWGKMREKD